MQVSITFIKDFSNRKAGEVLNVSKDTAKNLIEIKVAEYTKEKVTKKKTVKKTVKND